MLNIRTSDYFDGIMRDGILNFSEKSEVCVHEATGGL